jgi:hypothetical protein
MAVEGGRFSAICRVAIAARRNDGCVCNLGRTRLRPRFASAPSDSAYHGWSAGRDAFVVIMGLSPMTAMRGFPRLGFTNCGDTRILRAWRIPHHSTSRRIRPST